MADIDDMINNVVDQDFAKSQTYFDAIMQAKMSDTLEQEKIAMANRIFNLDNPEGENFEDPEDTAVDVDVADESDEYSDEELEAAAVEAEYDEDEEYEDEEEYDDSEEEEDYSEDEE